MPTLPDAWLKQSKAILAQGINSEQSIPFATSLLTALYGPKSSHLAAFLAGMCCLPVCRRREHGSTAARTRTNQCTG
jgi:hypothetical protein